MSYAGKKAIERFYETVTKIMEDYSTIMTDLETQYEKPPKLTYDEESVHYWSKLCHICDQEISNTLRVGEFIEQKKAYFEKMDGNYEGDNYDDEEFYVDPSYYPGTWWLGPRVRDHCHVTGVYRGPAHSWCNLQLRRSKEVSLFFHNLTGDKI